MDNSTNINKFASRTYSNALERSVSWITRVRRTSHFTASVSTFVEFSKFMGNSSARNAIDYAKTN